MQLLTYAWDMNEVQKQLKLKTGTVEIFISLLSANLFVSIKLRSKNFAFLKTIELM